MTNGEKIILKCFDLIAISKLSKSKKIYVGEILTKYVLKPDDLDLMTICKLEVIFGEKLLYIPTKQQWRKIKLEKLNEISKNRDNI